VEQPRGGHRRRGDLAERQGPAGEARLPLAELGRIAYFRPDTLPKDFQSELTVDPPLRAAPPAR
jgi:hypothetical protein